jgi:hypothetical protein
MPGAKKECFKDMASAAEVRDPDALPKVQLGCTGMNITRIGFGTWATGGPDWAVGWGPQSDEQSVRAIQHAIQRGMTGLTRRRRQPGPGC